MNAKELMYGRRYARRHDSYAIKTKANRIFMCDVDRTISAPKGTVELMKDRLLRLSSYDVDILRTVFANNIEPLANYIKLRNGIDVDIKMSDVIQFPFLYEIGLGGIFDSVSE